MGRSRKQNLLSKLADDSSSFWWQFLSWQVIHTLSCIACADGRRCCFSNNLTHHRRPLSWVPYNLSPSVVIQQQKRCFRSPELQRLMRAILPASSDSFSAKAVYLFAKECCNKVTWKSSVSQFWRLEVGDLWPQGPLQPVSPFLLVCRHLQHPWLGDGLLRSPTSASHGVHPGGCRLLSKLPLLTRTVIRD